MHANVSNIWKYMLFIWHNTALFLHHLVNIRIPKIGNYSHFVWLEIFLIDNIRE